MMRTTVRMLLAASIMSFAGMLPASAGEPCYEEVVVSEDLAACEGSFGNGGADFVSNCNPVERVERVEVECPQRWYAVSERRNLSSHGEFCSALGLSPGDINGRTCASGENIPAGEPGAETISYWAGRTGGTGKGVNSTIESKRRSFGQDRAVMLSAPQRDRYCWHNGQKKDLDRSDILVAWVCK